MGINLRTYNIRYGRVFELSQVIWAFERGNYDLMLLKETKIPYVVYCHNFLGYDVV